MDERRKFERIRIPGSARIHVQAGGKEVGPVSMIGRGGLMVDTQESFELGKKVELRIMDEAEGIHRKVTAIARYRQGQGVGFEFYHLDADAAVEIGVIIGKYYSHAAKK